MMKRNKTKTVDKPLRKTKITPFFDTERLSYSKLAMWTSSRSQFIEVYFKKGTRFHSPETDFGKLFAEKLENNDPSVAYVPKYDIHEYELKCDVEGIPCIGYIDSIRKDKLAFIDHKTGKQPWTQSRVAGHKQLDMYSVMCEIIHGFPAEDAKIVWVETMDQRPENQKSGLWNKSASSIVLTGRVLEFPRHIDAEDRKLMKQIIVAQAAQIEEEWKIFRQAHDSILQIQPYQRPGSR